MTARGESGLATVVGVALAGLLVTVAVAAAAVAALVDAHRRAESAADLAALAGGGALVGGSDPCAAAARIALRNDARLDSCQVQGSSVVVQVTVSGPALPGMRTRLTGRARAGPLSRSGWVPRTAPSWPAPGHQAGLPPPGAG